MFMKLSKISKPQTKLRIYQKFDFKTKDVTRSSYDNQYVLTPDSISVV